MVACTSDLGWCGFFIKVYCRACWQSPGLQIFSFVVVHHSCILRIVFALPKVNFSEVMPMPMPIERACRWSCKSARKWILLDTTEDLNAYFKQFAACRRDRFNQDGSLPLCCCHCQPRGWTWQTRWLLLSSSHFFPYWRIGDVNDEHWTSSHSFALRMDVLFALQKTSIRRTAINT